MIHTISAASHSDGRQYAMCGELLAPYRDACAAGHVVGNYASPELIRARVTCPGCLSRAEG